jgi:CheY-like chemotaxis protein
MNGHSFSFEDFEAQLSHLLQHLYDPLLRPPEFVWQIMGLSPSEQLSALQTAVIQSIEDLRPADYVPKTTRSWRLYGILYYRFVSNLAQEEVAERVSITSRHLRREQASAIHIFALKLWKQAELPAPKEEPESEETPVETTSPANNAQMSPEEQLKNDLMALQESAPGVISDINQVVKSVLALIKRLPAGKNLKINEIVVADKLRGNLHPSALRQVIWMLIHQCILQTELCSLSIQSGVENSNAFIELAFSPSFIFDDMQQQMIEEILEVQNGVFTCRQDENRSVFRVEMLNVNRTVLVVDDNPDIVHLYLRYLVGTPYHLVHLAKGQELFAQIGPIQPDIIVLDIMLPDVDGWDLLTSLSENHETRHIPVIVCSVVSEPDLALALGAWACISKPVQRNDFIRALDQASSQASAAAQKDSPRS